MNLIGDFSVSIRADGTEGSSVNSSLSARVRVQRGSLATETVGKQIDTPKGRAQAALLSAIHNGSIRVNQIRSATHISVESIGTGDIQSVEIPLEEAGRLVDKIVASME